MELDGNEYLKEIAYNAKGQRILISFGNGVMNRYTYDTQNFRLLRMKAEKYTFSENATERTYTYQSGTNRQDLAYEYDLNGNILKKKNRTPDCGISGTTLGADALDNQYTYDAISRLLSATGRESDSNNESHRWADAPVAGSPNANNTQNYNRQYSYDKVGNVKTLQQTGTNAFTRTFNYPDASSGGKNVLNKITVSSVDTDFTYDANGNLIQSNTDRFYEWNEKDQLAFFKIDAGGGPSVYAHYLYDAGGNRVKKIVWDQQDNKEVMVYIDGIFEYRLKQENSTDKEQNIIHVMDDATRIAQVRIGTAFNDDISEEEHYILDDHLGSSNARLDDSGSIIDRQEYYPFGDTSLRTYSKKRYQYVGKEKDAESGLIYYGARYYAAWTCRFISVDPLASKYQFYSPYIYAGNKPINKIDIDGLQEQGNGGGEQNGGGQKSTVTIGPNESVTHTFHHQADPPENLPNLEKMQPKGFANDATRVESPDIFEVPEPLTPRQAFLERADNLSKQSPDQGSIDYPSNDIRSRKFQAFDRYNGTRQFERAARTGVEIAETITSGLGIISMIKRTKGIKSVSEFIRSTLKKGDAAKGATEFNSLVKQLPKVGQQNVRTLQNWAKSKGFVKGPNTGGPQVWGVYDDAGNFSWRLKIKAQGSTRSGLEAGSQVPRFDARLGPGNYVNPLTGQKGGKAVGTHLPLY